MRELKMGAEVRIIHTGEIEVINRFVFLGSVVMYMIKGHAYYAEELELVGLYEDQHAEMVYDKISDTKEDMMASSEAINAIERMMSHHP